MPDRPSRLVRLLPDAIRRTVFEPAWLDLRIDAAERARGAPLRRAVWTFWSAGRVFALFVDCWRVWLTTSRPRRRREKLMARASAHLWHALRRLRHDALFTVSAVMTLALGVGANVAVFAVVDAVLLRPLPYPDADRLAVVQHLEVATGRTKLNVALGDYVDLAARQRSFESFGGYDIVAVTVTTIGSPFRVSALLATDGALSALRMQPALGRSLLPADSRPHAAPVVIVGHDFWERRLGGDPAAVGRHVTLGGIDVEIIGVAPAGFAFPPDTLADLVMPIEIPLAAPAARKANWTQAVGRLRPGVSMDAAAGDLASISDQMALEHPAEDQGSRYTPLLLRDLLTGNSRTALELLLGVASLVFLIACANVGTLWLARSAGRQRELALRLAIGADRGHLLAQFLAEAAVLVGAATAGGVAIAAWTSRVLVAMVPSSVAIRGLRDIHIDGSVLVFAAAIAAAAVIAFVVLSTASIRDQAPAGALVMTRTTDGPAARRVRSGLVMAELAMAVALLIGAGLVLRSLVKLTAVDPGFESDRVLTLRTVLPAGRYKTESARGDFYRRATSALRAVPGVLDVGTAAVVPLTGNNWTVPLEREDRRTPAGQRPPDVGFQVATSGFFTALRIPILEGRTFTDQDTPSSLPVVVISASVERQYFPDAPAVGRRILTDHGSSEIVGVVGDIRRSSLIDGPRADLYFSGEQLPDQETSWFIKVDGNPASLLPAVRASLASVEPRITVTQRRTMADLVAKSTEMLRFTVWLFGVFAALSLVLSAVGVYSVMSYVMRRRTREIGTRTALGATRRDILRLVLSEGALIGATGAVVGLAVGAILVTVTPLRSLLFGISIADPVIWTAAPTALLLSALAACYLPARRAATLDPVRALAND